MAQVVNPGTNTIKLNNGQTIQAQQGGWYDAQQYWGGQLSAPGVINSNSNQQGAGQRVSNEVIAQTNPANVAYVQQQQQNYVPDANSQSLPTTDAMGNPLNSNRGGAVAATVSAPPSNISGVGTGNLSATGAPTFDLIAATKAAYNTPEITAAGQNISDIQAKIDARQKALSDAQAGINDNPFYSEATRVGKSQQLTQQANNDLTVLNNQLTSAQGNLASLKADAAITVNAAQGQYNINEQAYKDNITQFNNLLSAGALDNASGQDIANLAVQTGIPTSMIQSMIQTSQKKNNPVQIVSSTDNAGNLTLLAVDSKGRIVNQTTIPGAGKSTTTGTGGSGGSASSVKLSALEVAQQGANQGKTLDDMMNNLQQFGLTPQQIYNAYKAADYYHATPDQQAADKAKYNVK